jgi:hypothetical protein
MRPRGDGGGSASEQCPRKTVSPGVRPKKDAVRAPRFGLLNQKVLGISWVHVKMSIEPGVPQPFQSPLCKFRDPMILNYVDLFDGLADRRDETAYGARRKRLGSRKELNLRPLPPIPNGDRIDGSERTF